MAGDPPRDSEGLVAMREETVERLSSAFAHGELDMSEFERRLDAAYAARDDESLRSLSRDLAGATTALARVEPREEAIAHPIAAEIVPAASPRPVGALAVFGHCERSGHIPLADGARVTAVFGNVEIDLRDAMLGPGITHLICRAVFGNVEITVPPDLAVECVGAGILGSFSAVHRIPSDGTAGRAVLRIVGAAVFGNVEVHTLPRGMPVHPISDEGRLLPAGRGG